MLLALIDVGKERGTLGALEPVGAAFEPEDGRVGILFAADTVVNHHTHQMASIVLHLVHALLHCHLAEIGQRLGILLLLVEETAQTQLAMRAAKGIALQPIAHGLGAVAQTGVGGVHVIETRKRLGISQCVVLCQQRVEQVLGLGLVFRHSHTAPIELYRCSDGIGVAPLHAFGNIFPSLLGIAFICVIACQAYGGIGLAQLEGFLVIRQRLLHILFHTANAIIVVVAQEEVTPRGAFFHRLLIQLVGLGGIHLAANAVLIASAQSGQSVGQPFVGPLLADGKIARRVLGHERAVQVIF